MMMHGLANFKFVYYYYYIIIIIIIIIIIACHAFCDGLTFLAPVYPMGFKESTPKVGVSKEEGFI